MILFRLISFGIRVISAFVFVLILQIQWDGKPLEHYLMQFGRRFVAVKILTQAGEHNAKALRKLASGDTEKTSSLSHIVDPLVKNMEERLTLPENILPQKQNKHSKK